MIDGLVQAAIEIDKCVGRPELFLEFVARYYFAGVCQQQQENLEWLFPEPDPQTLPAQFARVPVDFEYAKTGWAANPGHARFW